MCHCDLVFFSPFSIAITWLGEERAYLSAFRTFVRFVLVWICRFLLPLGVWEGLRFVIVALPGLFSYLCFTAIHRENKSFMYFNFLRSFVHLVLCWSFVSIVRSLFDEVPFCDVVSCQSSVIQRMGAWGGRSCIRWLWPFLCIAIFICFYNFRTTEILVAWCTRRLTDLRIT